MKRLQIIILYLVLAIPVLAYAFNPLQLFSGGVESSCCDTLTFVGDPGATESFECATAGNFCTTETTYTDGGDHIFDTYAVCMDGHCLRETRTGVNQNDNFVRWDFGATDAGFTFGMDIKMINLADAADAYFLYLHETTDMATYGIMLMFSGITGSDYIVAYNGSDFVSSIALTPGTTYRIIIEYVQNNTCTITLNTTGDVFVDDFTITSANKAPRYATRGHRTSSAIAATIDTDNVRYKSGGGGF